MVGGNVRYPVCSSLPSTVIGPTEPLSLGFVGDHTENEEQRNQFHVHLELTKTTKLKRCHAKSYGPPTSNQLAFLLFEKWNTACRNRKTENNPLRNQDSNRFWFDSIECFEDAKERLEERGPLNRISSD